MTITLGKQGGTAERAELCCQPSVPVRRRAFLLEGLVSVMHSYLGLYELVLEVADLEEAVEFYRDLLGMPVLQKASDDNVDGRQQVTLDAGDGAVIILWSSGREIEETGHQVQFALKTDADTLMELRQRLGDNGIPIRADVGAAIYVDDPDGNIVAIGAEGSEWVEPLRSNRL